MARPTIYFGNARTLLLAALLTLALASCNAQAGQAAPDGVVAQPDVPQAAGTASDAGGPGIDQTKLDICALLPRNQVEAAIGTLVEPPHKSTSVGDEVGCDYVVDQGRGYEVTVYNLDRWSLIPQLGDMVATAGIGDGAYTAREVGGGTSIYVLLRNRAVVGVRVNGANTPQFRQLIDLALGQVP